MSLAVQTMGARLTVPFAAGADVAPIGLLPGASAADATTVADDFIAEHHARFDAVPDPRYVVGLTADIAATLTVTGIHGRGSSSPVRFPACSRAGQTRVLDLGVHPPPVPTLPWPVPVWPAPPGPLVPGPLFPCTVRPGPLPPGDVPTDPGFPWAGGA